MSGLSTLEELLPVKCLEQVLGPWEVRSRYTDTQCRLAWAVVLVKHLTLGYSWGLGLRVKGSGSALSTGSP